MTKNNNNITRGARFTDDEIEIIEAAITHLAGSGPRVKFATFVRWAALKVAKELKGTKK